MLKTLEHESSNVFLTGDLGFMALEPLKEKLGKRFINAGVAEQNMVSVAAGMARNKMRPWVYSIAPFIFARAFEQIRNDICFHQLPVVLVGNGGGYGYGVMGATHHAIEDYGVLLSQRNLKIYIPAFDEDLNALVPLLSKIDHPAYLRLGLAPKLDQNFAIPQYSAWRKLEEGKKWTVLISGSMAGNIWKGIRQSGLNPLPNVWLLSELPIAQLPSDFITDLQNSPNLLVIEEHIAHGGIGQMLATILLKTGVLLNQFETRSALGYPSSRYGSQQFHLKENQLDPDSIINLLKKDILEV
ncbi:MAG: transketolase [Proteobacteria bacterium]|nr:transketolase [Pseudomonadota bacterium]